MATQNHTATFISLRENHQRRLKATKREKPSATGKVHPLNESLASNSIDDDEGSLLRGPKYTLPPEWVDAKDACEGITAWLTENLGRLEQLHKERLVVRFDDDSESQNDREVDALTRAMTRKFREAEDKLRIIGKIGTEVSDADAIVRKNVQRNLATTLQQISVNFRRSQNEYLNRLQNRTKSGIFEDSDSLNSSANSSAFLLTQEEERESLSKKIQHRDAEITKIAKNIQELATIFKELATLVIEQGTILDRIDYNMDMVVDRTERGVLELEKAEKYQRSNRANYCIFILVVLIVIFFAMIVAKLS